MARKKKEKKEFSKALLIQESALIWIMTLSFLALAALCIIKDYTGSLPWLTAMISLPWTAYGVSQCFYYNKAKSENLSGGIKYDTVMAEINKDTGRFDEMFNELLENEATEDIDINYGV